MKCDMAGGAAVLGTMIALGRLKPAVEVDGFIPITENMPGGKAQKPGDVIRFRNGKTVEVLNTDAEGRLILADALTLAADSKPDAIIDLATLTGACMVALGTQVAGIFGNDQALVDRLLAVAVETGEPLWQLPLVAEYKDDIKSAVADLKNIGGGHAGSITAGALPAGVRRRRCRGSTSTSRARRSSRRAPPTRRRAAPASACGRWCAT